MLHRHINVLSRRQFLDRSAKIGMAAALASLTDIPFAMKRALAAGGIGTNGKKVLFIWLRGANDALNSVIPILDPQYADSRPTIGIPKDGADSNYSTMGPCFDATQFSDLGGTPRTSADDTYSYASAIPLGNGFGALHPALKFLAPVYNSGDLALVHRVAYPRQSRSHFDSQRYWENGTPNNNLVNDGIFYRTIYQSGLANTAPLTGVSIQSSLPLILRGSEAAMTNLSDPTRYNLLSVPSPSGDVKADAALATTGGYPFPSKLNRELLSLQYRNLQSTLGLFAQIDFSENGNTFRDNVKTDGDTDWRPESEPANDSQGYFLFPTSNVKNGGWRRPNGTNVAAKYVVDPGNATMDFFNKLKSAALVLNKTDAIIAGTEINGFDTHRGQGGVTGAHANLNRSIGWSIYALKKFFTQYADRCTWDNLVVVTLSEFGRTTVENADIGTDHAEAGVMWVAGGGVKGYESGVRSGAFNLNTPGEFLANSPLNWFTGPTSTSAMFGVSNGYLKRNTDYRSVLGEIIRKHLGASQTQLNQIIPGYAVPTEYLLSGGTVADSSTVTAAIRGEVGFL
jgi:uncharacterized protein (DUF1501 family)